MAVKGWPVVISSHNPLWMRGISASRRAVAILLQGGLRREVQVATLSQATRAKGDTQRPLYYLLFAGIFLLNSCITPRSRPGKVLYGLLAGVLVMLLRYFGQYEEGVCFAILLVNALAPLVDRYGWHLQAFLLRRRAREEVQTL